MALALKQYHPIGGVLNMTLSLQTIKVYAPNDDGEKVIKVIGNVILTKTVKNITPADIISSISYFFNLLHGVGDTDDIDHFGNRRLRSVGELITKPIPNWFVSYGTCCS